MNILKVIFKQTWRDARAGDLRLLGLAVVIAVAAVTSVGFLADRVGRALERDAAQMLGADLVVESSKPIPPAFVERAQSLGLRTVLGWQFPSMVGRDGSRKTENARHEPGDSTHPGVTRKHEAH